MHAFHSCPASSLPDTGTNGDDGAPPIDYRPLRDAVRQAIAWALDVARTHATEPDDREAIDRVERAIVATLAGVPLRGRPDELRVSEEDVLVTAAAVIDRFEIDVRAPWLSPLASALYEFCDWTIRTARPTGHGARHHAMHRHADAAAVARALTAQLGHAPRVAHGPDEPVLARVLVLARR